MLIAAWIALESCGFTVRILALEAFKIRLTIGDNTAKLAWPSLVEDKIKII